MSHSPEPSPASLPPLSVVEPLTKTHELDQFDCIRHASLNLWLKRMAMMNQASGDSRTYIVHRDNRVVGYYSLAPGSVARSEASARAAKSAPDPVPIILLARLAVDRLEQGRGLGRALLKDALLRSLAGAETIGGRAVLVHAIDEQAVGFYRRFGFETCAVSTNHLMLLIKDIRKSLG